MGNMSYCRWRNTLGDFRDCVEHVEDILHGDALLGEEEADAMAALAEAAERFVQRVREELTVSPDGRRDALRLALLDHLSSVKAMAEDQE